MALEPVGHDTNEVARLLGLSCHENADPFKELHQMGGERPSLDELAPNHGCAPTTVSSAAVGRPRHGHLCSVSMCSIR